MNSSFRKLSIHEERNERILAQRITSYSLLFVTGTGLKKATFDATEPIRSLFIKSGFHDYEKQGRGMAEHGKKAGALFLSSSGQSESLVSLFKPKAKADQTGDPRFWPSGVSKFVSEGEVLGLFVFNKKLCFINLSREKLNELSDRPAFEYLDKYLEECEEESLSLAYELVSELRKLASEGALSSAATDEGVGFAIEKALNLPRNNRGWPDYKKRIEIKSGRGRNQTRLFSCKPDWDFAKRLNIAKNPIDRFCTTPLALLHRYGYWRHDRWNLACDVDTKRFNTQHLKLYLDMDRGILFEKCRRSPNNVAVWKLEELHNRLQEKHPETMFITARTNIISRHRAEYFLEKAVYLRTPSFSKFDQLISEGIIRVGHRKSSSDHGVAFQINQMKAHLLFLARPKTFDLTSSF